MKKLLLFCLLLFISAESIQTAAQESKETKKEQGIFNSVAVGLGVGTTGINIDVASPIGNHFALRGEVNIMPGFSYSDEVDASVLNSATEQVYAPINVEGSLARRQEPYCSMSIRLNLPASLYAAVLTLAVQNS